MVKSQKGHDPFADQGSAKKKAEKVGVYEKGTPEFSSKHNIHNPELLSLVERMESMKDELQNVQDDIKELSQEIKSRGFDLPTVKELLKYRKDTAAYQEKIALVGTYAEGIGEKFEIPGFYENGATNLKEAARRMTEAGDVTSVLALRPSL
jgi:uncharacterized protein (UPF0335 family)